MSRAGASALRRVRGSTLVELVVVLVVIGVAAAVAGLAFRPRDAVAEPDAVAATVARTRQRAIAEARPITDSVVVDGRAAFYTALPDGRVLADPAIGVSGVTGRSLAPDVRGRRAPQP